MGHAEWRPRRAALVGLLALGGCLAAPDGTPQSTGDGLDTDVEPVPQEVDAGAPECATAFAVAYVNRVTASRAGGEYLGMAVIEAIGDEVNLDNLAEGPDDGLFVELAIHQPGYELTPSGNSRGALEPRAENLIIDSELVVAELWDGAAPIFKLTLDEVAPGAESARVTADVWVGESRAVLEFLVVYTDLQEEPARAVSAKRVVSSCGE